MNKLYLKLLAFVGRKFLFSKMLENRKTSIISFIGILTGAIELFSDGKIYGFLCQYVSFFCNFTASQFYGGLIGVISVIAGAYNAERSLKHIETIKARREADKARAELQ